MKKLAPQSFLSEMADAAISRTKALCLTGNYSENSHLLSRAPKARNFSDIFRYSDFALIAEIKPCSPSEGSFRSTIDVLQRAKLYAEGGASALSIITEPTRFAGENKNVTATLPAGIPILRKDFIISTEQVVESRMLGADAILLIAALLLPEELSDLLSLSRRLGMEAVVEIHNREELDEAVGAGASIIGVNNRNLSTLKIDLENSRELIPLIPKGIHAISESGISERGQVLELKNLGAQGILVGSVLMRSEHPGLIIRNLLGK